MDLKNSTGGAAHVPQEGHRGQRAGWLRAAVLGADDGIVSVASLSIGVVASGASRTAVVAASIAALVAGAMSMAAGEYVSVSSQRDAELADLARERDEIGHDPVGETRELAAIYRHRGLPAELASQVADALMKHDPIEAHARDELGLQEHTRARPVQAALSSAFSFVFGALVSFLALIVAPGRYRVPALIAASMIALVLLGIAGAKTGGANISRAALRVGLWGSGAIAVTALVGHLFHSARTENPSSQAPVLTFGEHRCTAKYPFAERVGFEPTVSCPTHAFQACRFGRSRIPPYDPLLRRATHQVAREW